MCEDCEHSFTQDAFNFVNPEGVRKAVEDLLVELGVDMDDENFRETPRRVAAYLMSHFTAHLEIEAELDKYAQAVFPSDYEGMVVVDNIRAYGICPHHLLPIIYTIHVGYIPTVDTIGISKLARLPKLLARLPTLQEDLTKLIADELSELLGTPHVAVAVEGVHMCMVCRGVQSDRSATSTSTVNGFFATNDNGAKDEFYNIISRRSRHD